MKYITTWVDWMWHCFGAVTYVSTSSPAIEFSSSDRVKLSFPLTLFWLLFMWWTWRIFGRIGIRARTASYSDMRYPWRVSLKKMLSVPLQPLRCHSIICSHFRLLFGKSCSIRLDFWSIGMYRVFVAEDLWCLDVSVAEFC